MARKRISVSLTILCLLVSVSAFPQTSTSQGDAATQSGGSPFGMLLNIGTESLFDPPSSMNLSGQKPVPYQSFNVTPDLALGKLGFGLDLTFHFKFGDPTGGSNFSLYKYDWVPETPSFKNVLALYLPKIDYVRYGRKGEPFFVKLGAIDDATIANGFIVGGYSNMLHRPTIKVTGLSFDLDGALFKFPYVGIETFVGNLAAPDVIALRPFFRPLAMTDIPVLKGLEAGFTLAADSNPHAFAADPSNPNKDSIMASGVDFNLPLVANKAINLSTFGDLAFQPNKRSGGALGLGGAFFGFLNYGLQLRVLGAGFMPTYFNPTYDLMREMKYAVVSQSAQADAKAHAAWLGSLGTSFMNGDIMFNAVVDGPFDVASPNPASPADYPHTRALLHLGGKMLMGFTLDASYEKFLLGAGQKNFWQDLVDPLNAVIGAKIGFQTGPAIISLVYDLKYNAAKAAANDPEPFDITSSLQTSIKVF